MSSIWWFSVFQPRTATETTTRRKKNLWTYHEQEKKFSNSKSNRDGQTSCEDFFLVFIQICVCEKMWAKIFLNRLFGGKAWRWPANGDGRARRSPWAWTWRDTATISGEKSFSDFSLRSLSRSARSKTKAMLGFFVFTISLPLDSLSRGSELLLAFSADSVEKELSKNSEGQSRKRQKIEAKLSSRSSCDLNEKSWL